MKTVEEYLEDAEKRVKKVEKDPVLGELYNEEMESLIFSYLVLSISAPLIGIYFSFWNLTQHLEYFVCALSFTVILVWGAFMFSWKMHRIEEAIKRREALL